MCVCLCVQGSQWRTPLFLAWVVVKQKCQEDNILAAVSEEEQGQLTTLKWVSATSPLLGHQAHRQLPLWRLSSALSGLICLLGPCGLGLSPEARPLPAESLGSSLVPWPPQQKMPSPPGCLSAPQQQCVGKPKLWPSGETLLPPRLSQLPSTLPGGRSLTPSWGAGVLGCWGGGARSPGAVGARRTDVTDRG